MHQPGRPAHIAAIDLFCGVGGLTRGLEDAGINVVAGIDLDESCEFAYNANNAALFIPADITTLSGKDLRKLYPTGAVRMLAGCAPCQPYSTLTRKASKDRTAPRGGKHSLLAHFARLVREVKPAIVTMENVPNVRSEPVFASFLKTLAALGFSTRFEVLNCADYGVPQNRKRMVLIAFRGKQPVFPLPVKGIRTLRDAIGSMPRVAAGKVAKNDSVHKARNLSPVNLERMKEATPGGFWRDWDVKLRLKCHTKTTGKTFRSVYGRMQWDKPSSTITTQFFNFGTGRFGHPSQRRALTLREGALIQTFPKKYRFVPPMENPSFVHTGRHIGNAVPVKLGEAIGKAIVSAYLRR